MFLNELLINIINKLNSDKNNVFYYNFIQIQELLKEKFNKQQFQKLFFKIEENIDEIIYDITKYFDFKEIDVYSVKINSYLLKNTLIFLRDLKNMTINNTHNYLISLIIKMIKINEFIKNNKINFDKININNHMNNLESNELLQKILTCKYIC